LLIAKHHSFSRAAGELSYTPSALSHIADALEQELGLRLFVRTKKGVTLTPEGKALQSKFAAMQKAEAALLHAAGELRAEKEVVLRIGTISSIALHLLPSLLHSFKQAYPQVQTEILVDDNMHHWLQEGIADILLADSTMGFADLQMLQEDPYVAAVPVAAFPGRDTVQLQELYQYPFIRANEVYLDDFLDYTAFRSVVRVASIEYDSALYLVKGNLGVSVLPRLSTMACPPEVKILELQPRLVRQIGYCCPPEPTTACRQFIEHLHKKMPCV
jgi:DNA-binding transcriptional LysR family regulator